MLQTFKRLLSDDQGLTAIEYGLMAALIALVMALGATTLGTNLSSLFGTTISGKI